MKLREFVELFDKNDVKASPELKAYYDKLTKEV